jgi:O-antigen ligase
MPEHLRALVFILILASFGFMIAKKAIPNNVPTAVFNSWRNIWLAVLITAFIASNFWVYIILSSIFILLLTKFEKNKIALFFILLFVIPPLEQQIPGFGVVNYLLTISHPRFITLIILLPAAILISHKNDFKFNKAGTDKFLLLYMVLIIFLAFRDTTFTDALRRGLYTFMDIFLPYYVASRSIKNLSQMKVVLFAFVTSAFVLAFIGVFESNKQWLLFNSLDNALGISGTTSQYLARGDSIRVIATLGHSITFGYFLMVALGFYLFLYKAIQSTLIKRIGFLILIFGLLAPLSRGPWVGAAILVLIFVAQGPAAIKNLSALLLVGLITLPLLTVIPNGEKYLDLIPYVGKTETENIEYREKLFSNSLVVIDKSPLLGSSNFMDEPEMQELIQGQGIIDIVNSYLRITLESGYVGLLLFVCIFISVIIRVRKKLTQVEDKKDQMYGLGRSLVSVLLAIMVTIATVSSIGTIPIIYWTVLGLGVAYSRIPLSKNQQPVDTNS